MRDWLSFENIRLILASACAPIVSVLTPTLGYVYALVVMFTFNIWAGMRADGVMVRRCKNFKFKKFKNALAELLLYLMIVETVQIIMHNCGDDGAAILIVKSLTYVFMYVYLQNAFRNMIVAYPKNQALRMIYHFIRLEFKRMLPSYWQPILERYERDHAKDLDDGATEPTEEEIKKVTEAKENQK